MTDLKSNLDEYFTGSSRDQNFQAIREIFETGKGEEGLRHVMNEKWNEIAEQDVEPADLTSVLNKIHHTINRSENNRQKERRFLPNFFKVAAGIMLPILVASLWMTYDFYQKQKNLMNTWSEIVAPGGGRVNFKLPDGTTGWLNGYSELAFPLQFGKERLVKISGEAYFDVVHDARKPFLVDIPAFQLKVLGTRFSVTAFKTDNTSEVVLESGKVEILNKKKNNLLTLNPDRHLVIDNRTGNYTIDEINAQNFVSWKDGMLIFRNDLMSDVVKRLSRWYDVDIEMKDQKLFEYRFRATFKDESLEEVLNLLKISSPIDFQITERKMLDNGEFSRKKVTLYLKKGKTLSALNS